MPPELQQGNEPTFPRFDISDPTISVRALKRMYLTPVSPQVQPKRGSSINVDIRNQVSQYPEMFSQERSYLFHQRDTLTQSINDRGEIHDTEAQRMMQIRKTIEDILFYRNQRLGLEYVNRYIRTHDTDIPYADLFQQASIGILKAIEKYDQPKFETEFSTYAFYWMRHYVGRYVDETEHPIRIPEAIQYQVRNAGAHINALRRRNIVISPESVASELGISPEEAKRLLEFMQLRAPVKSLDAPNSRFETNRTIGDVGEYTSIIHAGPDRKPRNIRSVNRRRADGKEQRTPKKQSLEKYMLRIESIKDSGFMSVIKEVREYMKQHGIIPAYEKFITIHYLNERGVSRDEIAQIIGTTEKEVSKAIGFASRMLRRKSLENLQRTEGDN